MIYKGSFFEIFKTLANSVWSENVPKVQSKIAHWYSPRYTVHGKFINFAIDFAELLINPQLILRIYESSKIHRDEVWAKKDVEDDNPGHLQTKYFYKALTIR